MQQPPAAIQLPRSPPPPPAASAVTVAQNFDKRTQHWETRLAELSAFLEKNEGRFPHFKATDRAERVLHGWVKRQWHARRGDEAATRDGRTVSKATDGCTMTAERVARLEQVPGWKWGQRARASTRAKAAAKAPAPLRRDSQATVRVSWAQATRELLPERREATDTPLGLLAGTATGSTPATGSTLVTATAAVVGAAVAQPHTDPEESTADAAACATVTVSTA